MITHNFYFGSTEKFGYGRGSEVLETVDETCQLVSECGWCRPENTCARWWESCADEQQEGLAFSYCPETPKIMDNTSSVGILRAAVSPHREPPEAQGRADPKSAHE